MASGKTWKPSVFAGGQNRLDDPPFFVEIRSGYSVKKDIACQVEGSFSSQADAVVRDLAIQNCAPL